MWYRTPLSEKFRAVKLLAVSQRFWGDRFVPKFREVAREMEMTPQNLTTIWRNREAIEKRAIRDLPEVLRENIEGEASQRLLRESLTTLAAHTGEDYENMPVGKLIKAFDETFNTLLRLKVIE